MIKQFLVKIFIISCIFCSMNSCISAHVDWRTQLVIKGNVIDSTSKLPIEGVSVTLIEGFSTLSEEIKICVTSDSGIIFGTYSRKWGRKSSRIVSGSWRIPEINLKIQIMKELYHPVEMDFVLDEKTGVGGEITINLGEVILQKEIQGESKGNIGTAY